MHVYKILAVESQLDIKFAISANNSNHHYIPLRVRYWYYAAIFAYMF